MSNKTTLSDRSGKCASFLYQFCPLPNGLESLSFETKEFHVGLRGGRFTSDTKQACRSSAETHCPTVTRDRMGWGITCLAVSYVRGLPVQTSPVLAIKASESGFRPP